MKESLLINILLVLSVFSADLTDYFKMKNCDPKCTLETQNFTLETAFPKKCSTICADLIINDQTDLTEKQMKSTFSKMKNLIGRLIIVNTQFKSASFLAGLESIECGGTDLVTTIGFNDEMTELGLTNLTSISCAGFLVISNYKMNTLGVPNLKSITLNEFHDPNITAVRIMIDPLSFEFCITVDEMESLITSEVTNLDEIYGVYCEPAVTENLCKSPEICSRVLGDVEVGSNSSLENMKSIELIFGSLIISGTQLTNVSFLENLKYVAQLAEAKSAIIVENNPNLLNISFPKLKRVRSDINSVSVVFTDNNENLKLDVSNCYKLRNDLGMTTDLSPTFDGESCDSMNSSAPAAPCIVVGNSTCNFSTMQIKMFQSIFVVFLVFVNVY
ncbi:Receptor L-domain domain-containing protein [Caenorhabditis elegans]|uniref:Receptor L-domain domain-containing protein n=1 Tax=Caenorhabditis elegans TaxID=6239 RepID=Q9NA54_CAEEL|nr:Receptor L-domain domain-containing protein [Caenorhabditis elegans]CAB60543.2 Receptor L-domain domain-containing protein [Caenorhabditis elegans]|eukprot:NP_502853.2 Insulin/EGF-Receptor L Domain protein [Caenorhabditis elegans]